MGNSYSIPNVNFEYVQKYIKYGDKILINTMDQNNQSCLIYTTTPCEREIEIINNLIKMKKQKDAEIIIYGKNYMDEKNYTQYKKLQSLGFKKIYIYLGGIFEWLCLQEIYGDTLFPTQGNELDILKYKPSTISK